MSSVNHNIFFMSPIDYKLKANSDRSYVFALILKRNRKQNKAFCRDILQFCTFSDARNL